VHFRPLRSAHHVTPPTSIPTPDRTRSRGVGARLLRWGTFALVLVALTACGSTGGGSGAPAAAAVAVDPVYLTPGQTVAQLQWEPSAGPVDNYLVFLSRNGGPYAFSGLSLTPSIDVVGDPGDSVRITVVAISPLGEMSENSPASPPIIFQAPVAAAVAQRAPAGLPAPTAAPAPTPESVTPDEPVTELAAGDATSGPTKQPDAMPADDGANEEAPMLTQLVESLRALLLSGDARLPEAGLSTPAEDWLQAQVDHEIAAGVALAGTGQANGDDLRELVWQDPAGQLFVSDGETFLGADDLPATLAETLRLNATERFVGLDDFDGDTVGDWLLEDTATGEVWIVSGLDGAAQPPAAAVAGATLAGHGDFDGDGVAELLWIDGDRVLSLSSASLAAPSLGAGTGQPDDVTLLAIADLDGNGRDDLLGLADDGQLVMALAQDGPDGAPVDLVWQNGAGASVDGLDLVATVDVDADGAAELAWLNGDALEIWTAADGLQQRL